MTTISGQARRTPPSRQKARTFWTCPRCGRQFVSANKWHSCESFRLEGYLWLRRRAAHPLIRRVEMQVFRDYGHIFRLSQPADLDDDLVALLHEGYMLGCQPLAGR